MPQILPTFLGVSLPLDLKHQAKEYIRMPSPLRVWADTTQECPFMSHRTRFHQRTPQHPWTAGGELSADEKQKAKRSTESGNVLLPERERFAARGCFLPLVLYSVLYHHGPLYRHGWWWQMDRLWQHRSCSCWCVTSRFAAVHYDTANNQPANGWRLRSCVSCSEKTARKTLEKWVISEQVC